MAKISLTYKFILVLIAIAGIGLALITLASERIEMGDIKYKEAETAQGSCVTSSLGNGVKFLATYEDAEMEDYFSLPFFVECSPELLEALEGGHIKIGFYKKAYFGVILNGKILRSEKDYLDRFNNKANSVWFIFIVVFVSMFAVYLLGKSRG
jgi:hypothetical protein